MASIISDPSLDPAIKQVIQDLITYGDDKTKEAEWQNLFAENSCFRIGKIEFKGADGTYLFPNFSSLSHL
jgi:hypothetical protein